MCATLQPPAPTRPRTRTGRILRAVSIGYGYQAAVAIVGLVLTPFLLGRLGTDDYGQWLVVGQVLGLLGLLDLGATSVLPREVARASGMADPAAITEVVRRATWLVWLQTPVVALVTAGVWAGVSTGWPDLAGPLGVTLAAFVVQFPLRLPAAILAGLQDSEFCSVTQALAWVATTVLSVGLVVAGWGLYALAIAWAVGQGLGALACWLRLRRFPMARLRGGWPGRAAVLAHLGPSCWTSARQLAGLLLNGTDLIVLGWVIGPEAVVVYACTVKLINLVNNQPYLLMGVALPAIAELQADRERLWRASRAAGLGLLLLSGGLAVSVLAVNSTFVPWWVGSERYGGATLTLLAVLVMVSRHAAYAQLQTAFALGYDRVLAIAAIADGAVMVVATVGLTRLLGPCGVPLGSLTSLLLTNGPVAVLILSRVQGVSPVRSLGWLAPWAVRFLAVATPLAVVSYISAAENPLVAAALLAAGVAAYAGLALSLLKRDPLREYRVGLLKAFRRKLGMMPAS